MHAWGDELCVVQSSELPFAPHSSHSTAVVTRCACPLANAQESRAPLSRPRLMLLSFRLLKSGFFSVFSALYFPTLGWMHEAQTFTHLYLYVARCRLSYFQELASVCMISRSLVSAESIGSQPLSVFFWGKIPRHNLLDDLYREVYSVFPASFFLQKNCTR